MSTEGSVSTSSGIRQFGLYRTIDARTEEFLRLSRKRQIRQGCACAAISTAITVTIVITIILIYEYSIINESSSKNSLTSSKQNWLSLMNKSAEATPFEANLNKAKLNIDPTYEQFLPLILKTLNKNKYFDNIIEDVSTQTPIYDKGVTTEDLYTGNVFSDSSNWMRMPTSRLYTIEYKTSPIVYFKYPTRNIDHFTKVRRIRDYQRVMNYVDKMISDKVAFTSTIRMLKNTYSFHKKPALATYASTTPITNVVEYVTKRQTEDKKTKKEASTTNQKKSVCRCPKRHSQLLSKLIKHLQKMIPEFIGREQIRACNENKLKIKKSFTKELEHLRTNLQYEETMKNDLSDEISNIIASDFTNNDLKTTKPENNSEMSAPLTKTLKTPKIQFISSLNHDQTVMPNTITKTFYTVKPLYPKVDSTLSSSINIIKPHLIHSQIQQDNKEKSYTITTKEYVKDTDANSFNSLATANSISKTTSTQASSNASKTEKDFVLQKSNLNSTAKSLLNFSKDGDTEYSDYYTTQDTVDHFKVLDVNRLDIPKKAILAASDEGKNSKSDTVLNTSTTYPSIELTNNNKQDYNRNDTWTILKKMGKLTFYLTRFQNSSKSNKKSNYTTTIKSMTVKENADLATRSVSNQVPTKSLSYLSENNPEEQMKYEDVTLEEEIDNIISEEITTEDNLKSLENLLNKINVSEIFNSTLKNKTEKEKFNLDQYKETQIIKYTDTSCEHSKSMIPENRSSYLEIQRNSWKSNDEHEDYENI